jgi:aspartate aminotransferase
MARPLARAMTALQSHTTSNSATPSQHAALAALSDPNASETAIRAMIAELRRRRDAALELLHEAKIDVIEPQGAFYFYIHAGKATADDPEPGSTFAKRLLDEAEVAVVPGVAFRSPEWIRASYAAPADQVMEGMRRIISARIS